MPQESRAVRSATRFKLEEIARWQALGQSVEQIAKLMHMDSDSIARLTSTKAYREVQSRYIETKLYKGIDDAISTKKANVMLEEAAPQAAVELIDLLDKGEVRDRRQTATAILDRAGYGPIQKRAVKQRIEIDPMTLGLLKLAFTESEVVDVSTDRDGD